MRRMSILSGVLLLSMSCKIENEVGKIQEPVSEDPYLVIEPMELDFGLVEPMTTVSDVITFRNEGDIAIDLSQFHLEGAGFTASSAAPTGWLEPEAEVEMWIDYSPVFVEDSGWLTVTTTDPALEEAMIPLAGQGSYPLLVLDPPVVDFGWVEPMGTEDDGLTMRNDGYADLTITETLVVGADFSLVQELPLPITLGPGEEQWVDLNYSPLTLGEHSGALWVESNSPAGTAQAQLLGGSSDAPIAVCYVDPEEVVPLWESADWMGDESYDPAGAQITEYDWVLIDAPTGSAAGMPGGNANRYNFVADLAGTYTAQLTVHNEFGRSSEPCITSLEVIPEESLWIEMFWVHSGDDMDLHLLEPGGSLETDTDCYYMNCVGGGWLDWGSWGNSDDDPSLDIDDIPGTGPENINIYEPQVGSFEVYVHDFPGSVYSGSNDVTVRIYVGGELEYEETKAISGENSYTRFATVEWSEEPIVIPR